MFILCSYSERTFRFVKAALEIKSFFKSTWEIIKVGFPGASIGIFDVIFVYILNLFLASTLGNLGLTTYLLCVDALVIASIVNVGISETLTSIVQIYYAKHDYVNLNHLIRRALIIALICGVALIAFLWIWPEGFLSLYNFDEIALSGFAINALKLYSFFFILTILPSMLIFYYEAIERSVLSTIFSVLSTLILPLVSIYALYNMIGSNGIWLGFSVACIITTIIIIITVKVIQRKEDKYEGLFFIEKELVHKTKNFVLTNNDTKERNECLQHLRSLNATDEFCNNTEKIFDTIFDTNDEGTYVEVLVIDYEDNIHLDIKYDGEKENLDHIKNNFPEGMLKYTEVLGFNDIEYVMKK